MRGTRPRPATRHGAPDLVRELRERIAGHQYAPGARLGENGLAGEFGVCRGLIRRIPNRGAEVVRLDLSQMFAIYDVREMLEGLCVRLAVRNSRPASWQDLVALFGRPMELHVRRAQFAEYITQLERLRRRTIEAAANPVLADMLDSINDKTREIMRRIIILPGRASEGLKQHRAVLAAMRKGDAALAEKLKRENIRSSREYLERYREFIL
jgi:DNA-binding GntR family transcriptional regulator